MLLVGMIGFGAFESARARARLNAILSDYSVIDLKSDLPNKSTSSTKLNSIRKIISASIYFGR